jgi:Tol biopolymer transport system component
MKKLKLTLIISVLMAGFGNSCGLSSEAAAASGPNILFDSNRSGHYEIYSSVAGATPKRLTSNKAYDSWWPKMSPDHKKILFYRTPAGVHDIDYTKTSLWVMDSNGAHQHLVLANHAYGWTIQGHADWSPRGKWLVMAGDAGIFLTDTNGRNPILVGVGQDPSWSPDGTRITYISCPGYPLCATNQFEVYASIATGQAPMRLTVDNSRDQDPYYSPDNQSIAWIKQTGPASWGLYLRNAAGHRSTIINDGKINSKPDWAPDGKTIYFHRSAIGGKYDIYRIGSNGKGLTKLNLGTAANEYPDAY